MSGAVARIRRWHDEFTSIRRDLHAHPELGFEEHRTARIVAERLEAMGIEHHTGVGRTGIVAIVRGRSTASGDSSSGDTADTSGTSGSSGDTSGAALKPAACTPSTSK